MDKRRFLFLLLGLPVLACSASRVFAVDNFNLELNADFVGKYIWRGQNLSYDPVFQPGLNISSNGLTAGIWGNMDLTNINGNKGDFSELDYSLDYSAAFPGIEAVGYSVGVIYYDFDKVFKKAAQNNVVLEINAQPSRLDLSSELIRRAKSSGCKFAVNTDAHAVKQLSLMKYGLGTARRGWLESKDIINTYSFSKLKKLF